MQSGSRAPRPADDGCGEPRHGRVLSRAIRSVVDDPSESPATKVRPPSSPPARARAPIPGVVGPLHVQIRPERGEQRRRGRLGEEHHRSTQRSASTSSARSAPARSDGTAPSCRGRKRPWFTPTIRIPRPGRFLRGLQVAQVAPRGGDRMPHWRPRPGCRAPALLPRRPALQPACTLRTSCRPPRAARGCTAAWAAPPPPAPAPLDSRGGDGHRPGFCTLSAPATLAMRIAWTGRLPPRWPRCRLR